MEHYNIGFNPEYCEDAPTFEQVIAISGLALLEFGTPWCGHCQASQPVIKEVLESKPALVHLKVYDGKGMALGRAFKVKLWPTLILLSDGQELARLVRPVQADEMARLLTERPSEKLLKKTPQTVSKGRTYELI